MKKIALDALPLHSGHAARGMGVYTRRLIENLEHLVKDSKSVRIDKFVFSDNKHRLAKYDLLHYPYFDLFYHTLPLRLPAKAVVTVPDVTPLLYPKYYPPGTRGAINFNLQRLALKKAAAVITLTETSKKDIVRLLGVPGERVFPIYLAPNFKSQAVSAKTLAVVKRKYNLPEEFVLYIGDVNWNKNLLRLIKATVAIDKTLVIVGKSAVRTDYAKDHIENQPLRLMQEKYGDTKNILRLGFVEDAELNAIWQLATVYSMPSLYEGFGLSVIEAMDAGVPVVCARTQALVEVAGDAAKFFDPHSVHDIAAKIREVMAHKPTRADLIAKGTKRVGDFSWQRTARETLMVYKQVLGIKP